VLTDTELIPVVTDVIAHIGRIQTVDQRLSFIEGYLGLQGKTERGDSGGLGREQLSELAAEKQRADDAERALERLRNRRSVRVALTVSKPFRGLFRTVRSWKKSRSPAS
jgi:hypothetical protein